MNFIRDIPDVDEWRPRSESAPGPLEESPDVEMVFDRECDLEDTLFSATYFDRAHAHEFDEWASEPAKPMLFDRTTQDELEMRYETERLLDRLIELENEMFLAEMDEMFARLDSKPNL